MSVSPSIDVSPSAGKTFLVALVVFLSIGAAYLLLFAPEAISPTEDSGIEFPESDFVDLRTGEAFRLEEFFGKPVIVNFFGSWCANCISEMPEFEEAHLLYEGEVVFVGLAVDDSVEAATDLVDRTNVTYLTTIDLDRFMVDQVQPFGFPHTMLIDEAGLVVAEATGELDYEILTATIDENFPHLGKSQ